MGRINAMPERPVNSVRSVRRQVAPSHIRKEVKLENSIPLSLHRKHDVLQKEEYER